MRKTLLILFCGFFITTFAFTGAATKLSWKTLEGIEFEEKFVKDIDGYMLFPKFTPQLKNLNGKQVSVEGYVVPVDKSGSYVALSANPYAACFFCGKAGPASVMTVKLKKKNPKYKIDDYTTFTGTLRLNTDDVKEFYYILENADETPE